MGKRFDDNSFLICKDCAQAYITSDGKEHVGKKAYDLHLKSKKKQTKNEPKDSSVQ